jgi:Kdo2-lipid IVA lauroyltransferase/acyltransferase
VSVKTNARDVRTGGRWTKSQRAKNFVLYVLLRLALSLADRLPRNALLALGRAAGLVAHGLLATSRRNAEQNVRHGLSGCKPEAVVKACFVRAGENLMTCLLLRRPRIRALDLIDVPDEARARIESALAAGRGAVFVSAHLGPFEAIAAAVTELGYPSTVVVRESYDPRLDPLVDRHRLARGVGVIHRGAPGAASRILRALRRGQLVGFLPDLGGRVQSVEVPFLGQCFSFPIGPQRIAQRATVPLLVGVLAPSRNQSDRLQLEVHDLALETSNAQLLTRRVAGILGAAIARVPEHWLWMARAPAPPRAAPVRKDLALPAFPPAA